jgi:hypothetical protein
LSSRTTYGHVPLTFPFLQTQEDLRAPPSDCGSGERPAPGKLTRHYLKRKRWKGARVLPCVDDFLFFVRSGANTLQVSHHKFDKLLDRLGHLRQPTKGFSKPTQSCHHLGINIDFAIHYVFAPADKLRKISIPARHLMGRGTRNPRWLHLRDLESLA